MFSPSEKRFYKPDIIATAKDDEYEYYKMIYKVPSDYKITFREYCFGNNWLLTWDGNKWNGKNVHHAS